MQAMFDELLKSGIKSLGLRKFDELKRVICIQPHPDDTDVGIGGTIAKLSKLGCEVIYLTMTDDRASISDPTLSTSEIVSIRKKEQEEAAKILGVKELIWLDYADSQFYPSLDARSKIIRVIREKKPDAIFTVDPWLSYEAHPDHRTTGILASEAALFSGLYNVNPEQIESGLNPHQVEYVAYFVTSRPNFFYDITETFELKLEAVRKHKSQFETSWNFFESYIRFQAERYGKILGVKYAEAFKILPPVFLHYNVDAERL